MIVCYGFFWLLPAIEGDGGGLQAQPVVFPAYGSQQVNPDTRLILRFPGAVQLMNRGQIRVFDAATDSLVDLLDLSIAPGPRNTRSLAPYDRFHYSQLPDSLYTVKNPDTSRSHPYQQNYIGGSTINDAFHFYPVIMRDRQAIICLHNNRLQHNRTYYVQIDSGMFVTDAGFRGFSGRQDWVFSTKKQPPSLEKDRFVVAADGSGDFSTVQGAIDFMPERPDRKKTIFIRNGIYDEIIYFRNKRHLAIIGEDRKKTLICYANNGVFNTRKMSPDPALAKGSHSLRAVFAADRCDDIEIRQLTLRSLGVQPAQAEALLIIGQRNLISQVNIEGSGDALQATGTIYVEDSRIQGFGDNVLGYGAVFFNRCDFVSTYGPHIWVRNTQANHGNVLLDCTLRTLGDVSTTIARAPDSNGKTYPYAEVILIRCKLEGIRPEGWGKVAADPSQIRYWEYNSTNLTDGQPVAVDARHPASRQLGPVDKHLIEKYSNPAYILNGWQPNPVKNNE
ncbi:hypothetical protein GCM10027051_21000 [Niabella terrae]